MNVGDKVYLRPTEMASDELRQKVAALGDEVVGEVGAVSGIGVCTVLLPPGITIKGHSHPLDGYRHCIDLHESHLQMALEHSAVMQAKIMGISPFQLEVIDRLKRLGIPDELVQATLKDIRMEEEIISWAQGYWNVSEAEALSILNGKREPLSTESSGEWLGTGGFGTCEM